MMVRGSWRDELTAKGEKWIHEVAYEKLPQHPWKTRSYFGSTVPPAPNDSQDAGSSPPRGFTSERFFRNPGIPLKQTPSS